MSVNPDGLRKLLVEMDNQLSKSKGELALVNLQLGRVDSNLDMIKTTTSKLKEYTSENDTVWQGVGRAFLRTDVATYTTSMAKDEAEFRDTRKNLLVKQSYLETTLDKTVTSMRRIVGGAEKSG